MGKMAGLWQDCPLVLFGTAADADALSTSKGDIMDAGATPDLLNQLLARTFAELGATGSVIRTILLRDRYFVGHKFRCDGIQAVWLAGGSVVEFYDEGGALVKTVSIETSDEKRAA
jgi:hypothetical protein